MRLGFVILLGLIGGHFVILLGLTKATFRDLIERACRTSALVYQDKVMRVRVRVSVGARFRFARAT